MPHRANVERLEDILRAVDRIQSYVRGMTFDQFCADERTAEAVQFNFIVIGDAAGRVTDDVVAQQAELPWREMRALRNVVAHGYFSVSLAVLWQTITTDLAPLVASLRALVAEQRAAAT